MILPEGHVADPVEAVFHSPVRPFIVVELGGPGRFGGQAGDAVHDFLAGPDAVQVADVAAQPEGLAGTGEQGVACFGGTDGAAFGAVVPVIVIDGGSRAPVGIRAGQQSLSGRAGQRLVTLQN
ncbi:hypothetical protein, partial [Streptosporangium canum]|uniref:hypothetical protein n=1 Tax=Streptosporangium canum TaxID=324952 RepID=UPI001C430D66